MSMMTISFTGDTIHLPTLSDREFLEALDWERGVDTALKYTAREGDVKAFQSALQTTFQTQATGRESALGCGSRTLWSRAAFADQVEFANLLAQVAGPPLHGHTTQRRSVNKAPKTLTQRIEPLLEHLVEGPGDEIVTSSHFELIAALELLAFAGGRLRPQYLWRLWRHSLEQVLRLAKESTDEADPIVPGDVRLIERGELPFVAGAVFSDVAGASALLKAGRQVLGRELNDNADRDGTPRAERVERLPLWLAPLIRATLIAKRFNVRLWNRDQEQLLRLLIERAIPLCRPDGKAALSNGLALESLPVLVAAAELFGLPEIGPVAGYLNSVQRVIAGQPPRRASTNGVLTMPSNQSDWARFALLRSDWSVQADSVAVAHHRRFPQIEVTAAGKPLIHGDWTLELTLGDAVVELAEEWSCCCWQTDPDADYIELQMRGPGRLRVERIIMLSRQERFLLLADTISGVPRQRIEYRAQLPLDHNVLARLDTPTREAQLTRKGLRARVFPLAVAQDRILSTPHEFTASEDSLVLRQVAEGEGLFAPLVFDWHPARTRGEAQWRTLTVTEDGRVVTPDIAAGHRLKVADLQLLIYRSLKNSDEARAVLGHHTHNETVVARFDKKGDVDPILMVEPA